MIEKHVVDFELSQRLNFLGVNKEGVFLWIDNFFFKTGKHETVISLNHGYQRTTSMRIYNAYTASELLEMLKWRKLFIFGFPEDLLAYLEIDGGDTLCNTLAKMLIYLIENKLFKVEDINK